jgi:hypothetical protein
MRNIVAITSCGEADFPRLEELPREYLTALGFLTDFGAFGALNFPVVF